jgi:serine/threonine protein kinase
LEYLEKNLGDYTRNQSDISPGIRLRWAIQAAEGVLAIRSVGVVHCDISPRNFLLDHGLNLKISFRRLISCGLRTICGCRHQISTPSAKDDLFSLGSLIYFLVVRKYPLEELASDRG